MSSQAREMQTKSNNNKKFTQLIPTFARPTSPNSKPLASRTPHRLFCLEPCAVVAVDCVHLPPQVVRQGRVFWVWSLVVRASDGPRQHNFQFIISATGRRICRQEIAVRSDMDLVGFADLFQLSRRRGRLLDRVIAAVPALIVHP